MIILPHPNTYHVPGSGVIAGEYPFTPDDRTALPKLRRFVEAGITHFIDLTEANELRPYEVDLNSLAAELGRSVEYRRLGVRDMNVPPVRRMAEVLDALESAEAGGGLAYVHCWGGVGRTGTVVGCYLVRQGYEPAAALARVASLFATMTRDKVRRHPEGSPQTQAQREFVRRWADLPDGTGASNPGFTPEPLAS